MRNGMKRALIGLVALGLPVALLTGIDAVGAQTSSTAVSAESFGVYADALVGSVAKSPHAVLPSGGNMDEAEAASAGTSGVVTAENLTSMVTGGGNSHDSSSESTSTLENVDVLDGVVTADLVMAIASSSVHGTTTDSNAEGSTFANLVVAGESISSDVAPNTKIDVPGVGTVILKEIVRHGDGTDSTGITVNMIHVVLKDDLTGAKTGDVIVGSASTAVE